LAALLILLAALGYPLLARMLLAYDPTAALVVPSLVCVLGVCLVCPDVVLPPATLAVVYAAEVAFHVVHPQPVAPGLIEQMVHGRWELLGVPVAALALGYAAVLARRKLPLWRWRAKNNLRLLSRRPLLLARKYRWALLVLLAGALLDMLTTIRFMRQFGPEAEVHPGIRMMGEVFGPALGVPLGTVLKVSAAVFVAALWRRGCAALLMLCGALYALGAASNHFGWL